MDGMVYLDYAATTPVDPEVARLMTRYLGPKGIFGNAASRSHRFGQEAEEAVEKARKQVANLVNARPDEIIWTSGATESINLAIKGVAHAGNHGRKHIVTSSIEHRAVLDTCEYLERQGFQVTYLKPDDDGLISPEQVENVLLPETLLVSLMHVNNEIGTITDIETIGEITRARDIVFHIDAAQSLARLPLDLQNVKADLVSMSGHKIYGPKGVGALYVRYNPRLRIQAQIHGGGHEGGMRSGTLPTHQIVGMGEAARLTKLHLETDTGRADCLAERFICLLQRIDLVTFNGDRLYCVPGIINACFPMVESESLMMMLPNIAMAAGSACTSAAVEPSHVLIGLGLDEEKAHHSVRFSIGRYTTEEDIDYAAKEITRAVRELREISSLENYDGGWFEVRESLPNYTASIQD